jgi:uncharacterized RDD family membrane protein YckC
MDEEAHSVSPQLRLAAAALDAGLMVLLGLLAAAALRPWASRASLDGQIYPVACWFGLLCCYALLDVFCRGTPARQFFGGTIARVDGSPATPTQLWLRCLLRHVHFPAVAAFMIVGATLHASFNAPPWTSRALAMVLLAPLPAWHLLNFVVLVVSPTGRTLWDRATGTTVIYRDTQPPPDAGRAFEPVLRDDAGVPISPSGKSRSGRGGGGA